jgi:hypothetical protein
VRQAARRRQTAKSAANNDHAWASERGTALHRITLPTPARDHHFPLLFSLRTAMTTPNTGTASDTEQGDAAAGRARFRRTLVRVMAMQVVALIVLWWLQSRYTP